MKNTPISHCPVSVQRKVNVILLTALLITGYSSAIAQSNLSLRIKDANSKTNNPNAVATTNATKSRAAGQSATAAKNNAIRPGILIKKNAEEKIPASIYDFKVPALNGGTIDFSQFKGKKILIVNTKSLAGNDPQFAHLEAMYQKYKDKLVVIGFPDDDFGEHPSATSEPYFKKANYNVTFLMAAKVGVKGDNRAPIYMWLTEKKYNHFKDSEIKWDFQKYLVNEKGELVAEFDPKIKATGKTISAALEN